MPNLDEREGNCPRCNNETKLLRIPSKKKKIYIVNPKKNRVCCQQIYNNELITPKIMM